jgi:hypothetical protein
MDYLCFLLGSLLVEEEEDRQDLLLKALFEADKQGPGASTCHVAHHGAACADGENPMIGPTKLSTIQAEVRRAFAMPDAELLAWFNRQLDESGQKPKVNETEMETLRMLRDALVEEAKRGTPQRKARRVTGRSRR